MDTSIDTSMDTSIDSSIDSSMDTSIDSYNPKKNSIYIFINLLKYTNKYI